MQDSQILSTFHEAPPLQAAPAAAAPVFDACHLGVVLRAVLFVETVAAVGALYGAATPLEWLARLSLLSGGVLPATLSWLIVACALKLPLARASRPLQAGAGVALGALAGLGACALLNLVSGEGTMAGDRPPWVASAATGVLLAAGLVAALVWRAKGQTPAATTARLSELQARIRPHFLFNTLNSAIALVRAEPARAEALLEDLSDLFRHALAEPGGAVTLAEEIALAQRYLAIESVRFGERLRVRWSLDASAEGARLPHLLLQPLVENAVKHGVEPSASGADLKIVTERRGGRVVIKVTNTVPAGQGAPGHGLALANLRDRLRLLHDVQAQFQAALRGSVFVARIEVPLVP